jgi:hypothetical protein
VLLLSSNGTEFVFRKFFSFNEEAEKCRASKVIGINKYGINSQFKL